MRIRLIWPGKTKEKYAQQGIERFLKKLATMCDISIIETKDRKGLTPMQAVSMEGKDIIKAAENGYALFDERGVEMTSSEFASMIKDKAAMDFVIGGAHGVSDDIRANASKIVSLSKMTYAHDLARLTALEQIYRALMINSGRGYHH